MPLPKLHMAAYTGAIANTADVQVNALTDSVLLITSNDFIMPYDQEVVMLWSGGATLTDSRLNAPSLVTFGDLYVTPVDTAAIPADPPNVALYRPMSPVLRRQEAVRNKANDSTGTTDRVTTLVMFKDAGSPLTPIPSGQFCTFRFTSTTTVTANAWSQLAITFSTTPPAGTYAVIGCDIISTNIQAIRFIFQSNQFRPGFLGRPTIGRRRWDEENRFPFGVVGYFFPPMYPIAEVLANAADASFTGWLFCVKVSDASMIPG